MLASVPMTARCGIGIDRDRHALAQLEVGELGLLEVGLDIDLIERHQRQQPLAGLDEFAGLGGAVADDAVKGCTDDGVIEIERGLIAGEPVLVEGALGLGLLGGKHADIGVRRGDGGIGCDNGLPGLIAGGAGGIEGRRGGEALPGQRIHPVVLCRGIVGDGLRRSALGHSRFDRRFGGDDLLADAGDGCRAGGDLRFGPGQRVPVIGIIEDDQRVAGLDAGVVGRRHGLDGAGDLGGHDRGVGADISVVGGDEEAAIGPPVVAESAGADDDCDAGGGEHEGAHPALPGRLGRDRRHVTGCKGRLAHAGRRIGDGRLRRRRGLALKQQGLSGTARLFHDLGHRSILT